MSYQLIKKKGVIDNKSKKHKLARGFKVHMN